MCYRDSQQKEHKQTLIIYDARTVGHHWWRVYKNPNFLLSHLYSSNPKTLISYFTLLLQTSFSYFPLFCFLFLAL